MSEKNYKEFNPMYFLFIYLLFFIPLIGFGIYSDYAYKMKKLELIEIGKIKASWEFYEKK